jgi:predicted DNA-binding transcriptional regulator AlpA
MLDSHYRFVTIDDVAQRLCVNRFTAYHWLKSAPERLPRVTRIHGRVLFLEADVRAFFESFQVAAAPQCCGSAPASADSAAQALMPAEKRRRGRPTKAEQRARAEAAASCDNDALAGGRK